MQIVLQSSFDRVFWKSLFLFSALAYVAIAVRDYAAYRLGSSEQPEAIEQAIRLDPADAEYRNRLGDYFMLFDLRPDLAIPQYKSATSLNPHIAEYWLDLATAYASTGAPELQEEALGRALSVDPNTPRISQQVAYAYFIRGDLNQAFRRFRVLLQTDPWEAEPTLNICWQATHNIDAMSDVLPPAPGVYFIFLKILMDEKDTEAAETTWSRLIALRRPFDRQLAMPYFEYLIAQHRVGAVRAAWDDLARIDPDFRAYRPSATNLIVNGGFEAKLLNMGLDWRYEDRPGVTLAMDTEQFHGGSHSLSITFDGEQVLDVGLSQLIAVDPNSRYDFRAYTKSDDIYAAHGPQFVIGDAYTKNSLLVTEEVLGTTAWKEISGSFTTGPGTELVSLKIARTPGAGPITGRLWIDDVTLAR